MKICWDNLEKLEYRQDIGEWLNQYQNHYIYKDACKNCGEPFLCRKDSKGIFCDYSCSNHSKQVSEERKQKMSENHRGVFEINNPNWKGGYCINDVPAFDTYAHQISLCEKVRRNKEDPNILEVKCAYCGKWFIPTRINVMQRIKALNGKLSQGSESRLYCSENCKQECPIYHQVLYPKGFKPATSREVQPELRQMCFERDDFTCQKCGKSQDELTVGLHCHHIEGIRWEPLESADLDRVITFCKTCHIEVHKQPDCGYYDFRCKEK